MSDGISQLLLDLSLTRESKGSDFGLTKSVAARQHHSSDKEKTQAAGRREESCESKIDLMKDMTGRVVKAGIHFDYVLNDSWFTCTDLVRYVRRIHNSSFGSKNYQQPAILRFFRRSLQTGSSYQPCR